MEELKIISEAIANVLMCIVTIIGFVYAFKEYQLTVRKKIDERHEKTKNNLARNVGALYFVEQQAVERIAELTNENVQKIKIKLRKAAAEREDNELHLYPSESVSKFSNFITDKD